MNVDVTRDRFRRIVGDIVKCRTDSKLLIIKFAPLTK